MTIVTSHDVKHRPHSWVAWWLLLLVSSKSMDVGRDEPWSGTVGFPVGWRGLGLCFAVVSYDELEGTSVERRSWETAREFCGALDFAAMGDSGAPPRQLICSEGQGMPSFFLDTHWEGPVADPAGAFRVLNASQERASCEETLAAGFALRLEFLRSLAARSGQTRLGPRLPDPQLGYGKALDRFSRTAGTAQVEGGVGAGSGEPIGHTMLFPQDLRAGGAPLRVGLWPRTFYGHLFRERRILEEGVRAHPELALVPDRQLEDWAAVFGEQWVLGEEAGPFLMGGQELLQWMGCDVVLYMVDYLSADLATDEWDAYARAMDPRHRVPASRLLVLDMRDLPTSKPLVFTPPTNAATERGFALYLQRPWLPREDGAFSATAQSSSADSLAARRPQAFRRPFDFAIMDDFLTDLGSVGGEGTLALPVEPLQGLDLAARAAAWTAERPILVACLLRPNMPCRKRVLKWTGAICAELGITDRCFVGQLDDAMRMTFDVPYITLLRSARIVVTTKPCDYDGDYRTWEAFASGAHIVVDPMTPLPQPAPLLSGAHYSAFDPRSKDSLRAVLRHLVHEASDADLYRIAERGHLHALRNHRCVNRIDQAFVELLEEWVNHSESSSGCSSSSGPSCDSGEDAHHAPARKP